MEKPKHGGAMASKHNMICQHSGRLPTSGPLRLAKVIKSGVFKEMADLLQGTLVGKARRIPKPTKRIYRVQGK